MLNMRIVLIAFIALVACALPTSSTANDSENYIYSDATVKAAYILNLSLFVTFPEKPPKINICVVGDDLIGISLANIQSNSSKELDGIQILKRAPSSSFDSCNIVYISAKEADRVSTILFKLEGQPSITISDVLGFSDKGGMIELINKNQKVLMDINAGLLKKRGVRISAKVLGIANKVIK